ncbi:SMC6 protein [Giardia lamblia P15]|uniref:SMC6 protein n=1 Tax=Giardia intestinalis (strain P15) TaxID=658858 RepID=E1EW09_GIAIA|nr:SMC6 protein [Giardia lamblia P15]
MNHQDNLNATLPDDIAALARHPNKTVADIFSVSRHPVMYTRTGYILRLHITNFLTHRDKIVDFTCPVSLIHGPNGAGKSSILQAIHFVLGGKAKNIRDNCERFSNLKTVVCLKDTSANVQTTQCSVIAYFYYEGGSEFSGPIIGLKRTVTNEVTNFFLCTSFPPSTKSSPQFERISFERAHSILVNMGHFPDNEITMVSQSRMKVLVRMKPVDRYKIFSTAMSFDEIETNLTESQLSLEASIAGGKRIAGGLKRLMQDRKRVGKRIKAMKEYYEADVNLNKAGLKKVALSIQKHRVHVQNHRLDVEQAEKKELVQLLAEHERQQDAKANLEPYLKRCNIEIDELTTRLDEGKKHLMDLIDKLTAQKSELEATARHINTLEGMIKTGHEDVTLLKKEIAQHTEFLSKVGNAQECPAPPQKSEEHKRLEAEEHSLQLKLLQLQAQKSTLESTLLNIFKQKEWRQDREAEARQKCENAKNQLSYLQRQLELEASGTTAPEKCINSLYPANYQIYVKVKAESFSGGVVAPLAAYVWVKESSSDLAPIIRRVIGPSLLNTIAYRDKSDEYRLRNILGRSMQLVNLLRSTIPTMDEYNMLVRELDPVYKDKVMSVMQCLGNSSPFALEVLQLKVQLSRLVICETLEVARIVLEIGRRLRVSFQCLPKDRECIMFTGTKNSVIMKPAYSNRGSIKAQSLYSATTNRSNLQSEIQHQQRAYETAKVELESNYSAAKVSVIEAQETLKKNEVQGELESIAAEMARILQTIEANNSRLVHLKQQYAQSVECYSTQQREVQNTRRQLERSRAIVESSGSKLVTLESKLAEMTSDLERSNSSLKDKQDIIEQQKRTYDKCEADVAALEDRLTEKVAHRESIQAEDLDKQISQTENAIATCQEKVKTLKEFLASAQSVALSDLRTFLEVFENLSNLVPEYKERQNTVFSESLRGVQPCNLPVDNSLRSAEQTVDQNNSPFKDLYATLDASENIDVFYYNSMTRLAFLLVDFLADYSVFAEGQDAKDVKSIPDSSYEDNEQLLININNLLSTVSEEIQRIEEKKNELAQEFNGDIEAEKRHLLRMEDEIRTQTKEYTAILEEISSLGEIAVRQLIKLTSIRSHAEHDISFHFRQTSEITGINQRLYFQFPALPTVSPKLLELIDKQITDRYYDICGAQLHASWGVDPLSRSRTNVDETSDDANQQPITTIAPSKGSIDIRSITRGVTSLSGGESTFISLCFMVSCWLVIKTRYAQIDEWDVFMDATRRKRAFKLMLDAILQTSVQVVLVTPSDVDISDLDEATKKVIGIIKLLSIRT